MKAETIWAMEFVFAACFCCIPGMVRVSCDSLSELLVNLDDIEGLCKSSLFLGDGPLAKTVSVLLIMHTSFAIVPLTMFFIVTFLGNVRHYKACRVYGMLVRADLKSPPPHVCPVLDLNLPNNIRAWVRSRLGLHFFGVSVQQLLSIIQTISSFLICLLYISIVYVC